MANEQELVSIQSPAIKEKTYIIALAGDKMRRMMW